MLGGSDIALHWVAVDFLDGMTQFHETTNAHDNGDVICGIIICSGNCVPFFLLTQRRVAV